MCGYTNNGNNSNQCTIVLIIVIFALQGLLNGSSQSRTALILLFLFWLCGMGGRGSYAGTQILANTGNMQLPTCYAPVNPCCYAPVSMRSPNCGDYSCGCKKKDKHHKNSYCKCERVKVCLNNSAISQTAPNNSCGCGCCC